MVDDSKCEEFRADPAKLFLESLEDSEPKLPDVFCYVCGALGDVGVYRADEKPTYFCAEHVPKDGL